MAKAKKLPSGNWRVQAYSNGIHKSFTAPSKREAELQATQWQMGNASCSDSRMLLSTAYDRYISAKENVLSPSTIRSYKQMKNTTMQTIQSRYIDSLTAEQIQREVNTYAANHSPKSVKNAYGLLTAVLKMFRPGFNPNISMPPKEKQDLYIPTDEDIKALLDNSNGDLKISIMLGAFAAMRRGEICALTSDDISGTHIRVNKSLSINTTGEWITKTPKTFAGYRNIEIPPFVITALNGKNGKIVSMSPSGLSCAFRKLVSKLGLQHFRFHDLRHYYVSHCFDLSLPEKYIIAQVGHSSSSITKRVYDHVSAQKSTEYANKVAASFSNFNNISHKI